MPILFNEQARISLINGISLIANAVKSTMGPGGRTVVMDSKTQTRGLIVTKDGVTVAKHVYSDDPVENMGIRILREASEQTAEEAGDGTTTAIVIAEEMAKAGMESTDAKTTKVIRNINRMTDQVIAYLEGKKKRVTKKNIRNVATISANGDKKLGKIISDVYNDIGLDGSVSIETSQTGETHYKITDGIKIERGLYNQLFVNEHLTNECRLEESLVLMTDIQIDGLNQILRILEHAIKVEKKPILVIAPMAHSVIAIFAKNFRDGIKMVPIEPPGFGYRQPIIMDDLATAIGGKFFSKNEGDNLELIQPEDLGLVKSVRIARTETVIEPKGFNPDSLYLADSLKKSLKNEKSKKEREFIQSRLSMINGKMGSIFVGANSEVERKEIFDRVDDAVCAVRSALEEGVIPGGGIALLKASLFLQDLWNGKEKTEEEEIALDLMVSALEAPFNQILKNAELYDIPVTDDNIMFVMDNFENGIDASTGEVCNMYDRGIIDPLKVTKNALKNAVSVATTIMSTATIITKQNQ